MGCHTWCFKEIPCPEKFKNVYSKIKEKLESQLEISNSFLEGSYDKELWKGYNIEQFKILAPKQIKVCKEKLNLLKKHKNYCDEQLLDIDGFYDILKGFDLIYRIDGKYYDSENTPWDIFRKYNYPKDRLWSLKEAYNYYINPENNCYGWDSTLNDIYKAGENKEVDRLTYNRLKEFFDNNNGFIEFG